jgi:predicted small lipoprotein YifL
MLRVFAILASAALLAGCGQKGPLYLPVVPAGPGAAAQAPAATTPVFIPQPPASAPPTTGTASPLRVP